MEGDVVIFAFIVLLAMIFFLDHQKKMMMLAKGWHPDKIQKPESQDHLLAALVFCFIGLAFLISMLVLNAYGLIVVATILIAIGLALLIDHKIRRK